jgi:CheY-like chemotaxis protein
VLVLDADEVARDQLCGLLRGFGFDIHPVADPVSAAALLQSRSFAAIFADVALDAADGGGGIDLCQQIREANRRRDDGATLMVLVSAQLRPIDRVRAELAGCDDAILKPVTRGNVARVLDARDIALPADDRRL